MKKHIYTLLILLPFFSFSQQFYKIDSTIQSEIASKNISGGVAFIYQNGKVIHHKAYGFSSIADHQLMDTNSIFRIASQTKAIVSIAFLQLVDKNKISLDDPIEKYIPVFRHQKVALIAKDTMLFVEKNRSITISDLLTHTAGISSVDEYPKFRFLFEQYKLSQSISNGYKNLEEEVNQIAKMPLVHQPGDRFSYGFCTDVIGRLIEVVSGLPLDKYLKKNIFDPLNMEDTYFYLPETKKSRLVKVYTKFSKDSLMEIKPAVFPVNYPLDKNNQFYSAIGGLVSTTHDYSQFLICLLNKGKTTNGKQMISEQLLDQFWTNQIGDKTFVFGGVKSLNNFGLGVGLTTKAGQVINHASEGSFFWGGAFNTAYMVDRKRNLITLFYFQRAPFVLPPLLSKLEKTTIDITDQIKNAY